MITDETTNEIIDIPKYSCGTDDITFCIDKYSNDKCFRNPCNRIYKNRCYSAAYFKNTKYCPLNSKLNY